MSNIGTIGGIGQSMQGLENLRQTQRPESSRMTQPSAGPLPSAGGQQRPDPTQMAEDLYTRIDTTQRGSFTKADLQTALDTVSASSGISSGSAVNVDEVFAFLDADGDGTVSKQSFVDTMVALRDGGGPGAAGGMSGPGGPGGPGAGGGPGGGPGGGGPGGPGGPGGKSSQGSSMSGDDPVAYQFMTLVQSLLGEDSEPASWVSYKA